MKKLLLSFLIAFSVSFGAANLVAVASAADPTDAAKSAACQGITGQTGGKCDSSASVRLSEVVEDILVIISIIAGVLAVIMIIIAGIKYITSNGDAQAVAGAKRTLIYAIVGLIVVALSQAIVFFVLNNLQASASSGGAPGGFRPSQTQTPGRATPN